VPIYGGAALAVHLALTGYDLIANKHFDAQAFGVGVAAILTSIGAGAGIKAKLGG
jgi:hypothetical protein